MWSSYLVSCLLSPPEESLPLLPRKKDEETNHHITYLIQPLMMTHMHELLVLILDKVFMLCSLIFLIFSCSLCFPNYLAQECLITPLQMLYIPVSDSVFISVCTTDSYLIRLLYFKECYVTMWINILIRHVHAFNETYITKFFITASCDIACSWVILNAFL